MSEKRKNNELKLLARIGLLYGGFEKNELLNVLNINASTLNKESGVFRELFEDVEGIRIRRMGEKEEEVSGYQEKNNNLMFRKMYLNAEQNQDYDEKLEALVKAARLPDGFKAGTVKANFELMGVEKSGSTRSTQLCEEFRNLGLLDKKKNQYYLKKKVFECSDRELRDNLIEAMRYFSHVTFPGLMGFSLLNMLQTEKERQCEVDRFQYQNLRVHTVFDEEMYWRIYEYLREQKPVKLGILYQGKKDVSVNESAKRIQEIFLPYYFIQDDYYGRTYLIAWSYEENDFISILTSDITRVSSVSRVEEKNLQNPSLETLRNRFQVKYAFTWLARGQLLNEKSEPLIISIQYSSEEKFICQRVAREGITDNRRGRVKIDAKTGMKTYTVTVADFEDIKPWILSFGSRVVFKSAIGLESGRDLTKDIKDKLEKTMREVIEQYAEL